MEVKQYFEQLQRESTIFGSLKRNCDKAKYLYKCGFEYVEVDAIIMKSKSNRKCLKS